MTRSSDHPLVGRLVDGRYRVLHHIADGGMGSVYAATDERLDRQVALKVMRSDLARDASFVERFRREARSAARLSHPNVVGVYDQGQDEDLVFLAMEYVDGQTLRSLLAQQGALAPRDALRLSRQVLAALGAAHQAGLVHRDVKPENVLLDARGEVKVADFGLARAVTAVTTTTVGATVLGTVSYLAPEQVEHGTADARSDVYAAGLLLFEMLTGARAVDGDTPIQVAYRHVHGEIPAPSSLRPRLDPALDGLVASATRRDPAERPADAEAFLQELRRVETSLPAAALDLDDGTAPDADQAAAVPQPTDRIARPTQPVPRLPGAPGSGPADGTPVPAAEGPAARAPYDESTYESVETSRREPRRPRSLLSRLLAGVLALLLLVGGGIGWYMFAGPGSERTVPRLAGLSEQQGIEALAAVDVRANPTPTFSEDVPVGTIISADPGEGSTVRRGSAVTLAVSKGKDRVAVPDLVGHPIDSAKKDLTQSRLSVGAVTEEFSETVSAGQVVSSQPAAGTSSKPGTPVALVVSKGRQPIELKDWTGKPYAEAEAALKKAGLVPQVISEAFSNDVPQGSIIEQSPAQGTAYKGTQITFTVSKGPDLVPVPEVVGKPEKQAVDLLQAAGFKVEVYRIAGGLFGTAHSTVPGAGSKAPRGSTLTLRVV